MHQTNAATSAHAAPALDNDGGFSKHEARMVVLIIANFWLVFGMLMGSIYGTRLMSTSGASTLPVIAIFLPLVLWTVAGLVAGALAGALVGGIAVLIASIGRGKGH